MNTNSPHHHAACLQQEQQQQQLLEQARKEALGRVEEKLRREEVKDAVRWPTHTGMAFGRWGWG